MKHFLSLFLLAFIFSPLFSQKQVDGFVINNGGAPIPYASVAYVNNDLFCIADSNGHFIIKYLKDSLRIACVGFQTQTILPSENKIQQVVLSAKDAVLPEVRISNKVSTTFIIGHQFRKLNYFSSLSFNRSIAVWIPNEKVNDGILRNVHFKLKNVNDCYSLRIQFFKKSELTNLPAQELYNESIIVDSRHLSKDMRVDLRPFNITIPIEGFFVAFAWIKTISDCDDLIPPFFCGNFNSENPFLYRQKRGLIWYKETHTSAASGKFQVPYVTFNVE